MTRSNDFDDFLAAALAPPEREEDHAFVLRVQQRIRIEEALQKTRVALFERLSAGIAALVAVAAAMWWLVGSADFAALAAESPAPVLAGLVVLFMSLVWLMAPSIGSAPGRRKQF